MSSTAVSPFMHGVSVTRSKAAAVLGAVALTAGLVSLPMVPTPSASHAVELTAASDPSQISTDVLNLWEGVNGTSTVDVNSTLANLLTDSGFTSSSADPDAVGDAMLGLFTAASTSTSVTQVLPEIRDLYSAIHPGEQISPAEMMKFGYDSQSLMTALSSQSHWGQIGPAWVTLMHDLDFSSSELSSADALNPPELPVIPPPPVIPPQTSADPGNLSNDMTDMWNSLTGEVGRGVPMDDAVSNLLVDLGLGNSGIDMGQLGDQLTEFVTALTNSQDIYGPLADLHSLLEPIGGSEPVNTLGLFHAIGDAQALVSALGDPTDASGIVSGWDALMDDFGLSGLMS